MAATPREIGTLVVVILKAQHLPNKRSFGKQAPYCTVTLNGEKKRTRAIKKGGQHPEWDDELRFTLFEDTEDMLERIASTGDADTPPPPPPKEALKKKKKAKGGNKMLLACYADEPKEPELIGETVVDLTEVLTKGETDEWFTLSNRDKFSGEVYLELTFWSNEKAPEKKSKVRMMKPNQQYGGPGSFVPSDSGTSVGDNHTVPQSLRSASSLAQLSLYNPQYESQSTMSLQSQATGSTLNKLADEFGGLSVGAGQNSRRRESFPPPGNSYRPESAFSSISSSLSEHSARVSESGSSYSYDDSPRTPIARHHRHSMGEPSQTYSYRSPYDPNPPSTDYSPSQSHSQHPQHPQHDYNNTSMYGVPSTSTGFMSVPTPAPSGFITPPPNGVPAPSGFAPPMSHSSAPNMYPPHPSQTPVPYGYGQPQGYVPPPSSMGFHQPQPYASYPQYPMPPASAPPPPVSMYPPGPPPGMPMPSHSAPPQHYPPGVPVSNQITGPQYPGYAPTTPSPPGGSVPYNPSPPVPGSRPLPLPGGAPYPGTPPHAVTPTPMHGHSPTHSGSAIYNGAPQTQSHPLPNPPGPPGHVDLNTAMNSAQQQQTHSNGFIPPPPPPPLRRQSGGLPPPLNQGSLGGLDAQNGMANTNGSFNGSNINNGQGQQQLPSTRPPLPQPPGGNGSTLPLSLSLSFPPPAPSVQNGGGSNNGGVGGIPVSVSGFQVPPPPPIIRRNVSLSYPPAHTNNNTGMSPTNSNPLPPPPPRSVQPGEIYNPLPNPGFNSNPSFNSGPGSGLNSHSNPNLSLNVNLNPGPPPRPPAQMVYDNGSGFWMGTAQK